MPRQPTGQAIIRLGLSMPVATVERIRELATTEGVSVSEWIRRAVDEAIRAEMQS